MLANAAANILQFRMRRLDIAFFYLFPYWILLGLFLLAAWPLDGLVVLLFGLYGLYQLYAAAWGWRVWTLNRQGAP